MALRLVGAVGAVGPEASQEQGPAGRQEGNGDDQQGIDDFKLSIHPHVSKVLHNKVVEDDDAHAPRVPERPVREALDTVSERATEPHGQHQRALRHHRAMRQRAQRHQNEIEKFDFKF